LYRGGPSRPQCRADADVFSLRTRAGAVRG
jgi:hypothetical protein